MSERDRADAWAAFACAFAAGSVGLRNAAQVARDASALLSQMDERFPAWDVEPAAADEKTRCVDAGGADAHKAATCN